MSESEKSVVNTHMVHCRGPLDDLGDEMDFASAKPVEAIVLCFRNGSTRVLCPHYAASPNSTQEGHCGLIEKLNDDKVGLSKPKCVYSASNCEQD